MVTEPANLPPVFLASHTDASFILRCCISDLAVTTVMRRQWRWLKAMGPVAKRNSWLQASEVHSPGD